MVDSLQMANDFKIKNAQKCRLCRKSGLKEIFDFGMMSLPTWPHSKEGGIKAPLKFVICPSCFLGQLAHSIDRENLFREYWYRTGINDTMRSHMAKLSEAVSREIHLSDKSLVVDIGANDGTLLSFYQKGRLIGFEPSNLCPKETKSGILWVNDFFDPALLPKKSYGSVDAVTTIAMFYYLDDPTGFASIIESILSPQGIWVCEMTYALDIMKRNSFDFINHEHVTTWSAGHFKKALQKTGLELFKIERNDLNGGSIRFWVGRRGHRLVEPSVADTLAQEAGEFTMAAWTRFAQKISKASRKLRRIVLGLSAKKTVMAYGASTRGLTILGAAGLDSSAIVAAVERNPEKVGRYYGATGIPVINEEEMRSDPPDALLILPYSFINEFLKREMEYLKKGGVFIVPLPEPKILTKSSKETKQ